MDIARLSPAALQLLSDLKKLSGSSENALLEQAILHYYREILGKAALRQKLQNLTAPPPSSILERPPSPDQQDVLSWLGEAFLSDPIPIELPKIESSNELTPTGIKIPMKTPMQTLIKTPMQTPMQTPVVALGTIPISINPPGVSLETKPNLQIRRSDLGMSRAELAQQSGLEEELLQALEEGNLILLNLQEQWSLASALDWSLETLQEAISITSF